MESEAMERIRNLVEAATTEMESCSLSTDSHSCPALKRLGGDENATLSQRANLICGGLEAIESCPSVRWRRCRPHYLLSDALRLAVSG